MTTGPIPLDCALDYAARGWRVLPVFGANADGTCRCGSAHADSPRSIGKHPRVAKGVHAATTDLQQLREWWGRDPDAAIGVAAGAGSGLLVLDVDGEDGQASLRALEAKHGSLPATPLQVTGSGGEQYLFRHVDGLKNAVKFMPGLDVRTDGGYAIVPPSLHKCGRRYEWDVGLHPDEVEIACAPAWLVEAMAKSVPREEGVPVTLRTEPQDPRVIERARAYLAKIPGAVSGDDGHGHTFKVSCALFQKFDLTRDEALLLLTEWNERCQPPWSPQELDHKLDDAVVAPRRYPSLVANIVRAAPVRSEPQDVEPQPRRPLRGVDSLAIAPVPKGLALERGDDVEVSKLLVARLRPDRGDLAHDEGAIHAYDPAKGIWVPYDRARLIDAAADFAGCPAGPHGKPLMIRHAGTVGAVRLAEAHLAQPGFFGEAPACIAFADGTIFVDAATGLDLRTHDREHRLRFAYDFSFETAGSCPRWLAVLDQLLGCAADGVDRIRALRELIGVSLLGIAPRYQRAIALVGQGSNGKSVVLSVIGGLAPPNTVCSIPPHTMGSEYRLAMLAGKLINVVSELPRADLTDTETFKAIISGDPTTARPIREAPFTLHSRAGHFFAGNAMPASSDVSEGYWRRWIVIPFEVVVPPEQQIPNLADQVLADERKGIIRWALEGAADLIRRGRLLVPPSSDQALGITRAKGDSVRAFVAARVERVVDGGRGTQASSLHAAYELFARRNRFNPLSSQKFAQGMRSAGLEPKRESAGNYYPVTLRPETTVQIETPGGGSFELGGGDT